MLLSGTIIIWSGSIETIPDGWFLCDGNNGTPDLHKKFIVGAGDSYDVNDFGGDTSHEHNFTTDGHFHNIHDSYFIITGAPFASRTTVDTDTGLTQEVNALPTFYTLAFIMLGF